MANVTIHLSGGNNCQTGLSGEELDKFVSRVTDMSHGTITIEGSPKLIINVRQITLVEIT
jgi:hypothetical protein